MLSLRSGGRVVFRDRHDRDGLGVRVPPRQSQESSSDLPCAHLLASRLLLLSLICWCSTPTTPTPTSTKQRRCGRVYRANARRAWVEGGLDELKDLTFLIHFTVVCPSKLNFVQSSVFFSVFFPLRNLAFPFEVAFQERSRAREISNEPSEISGGRNFGHRKFPSRARYELVTARQNGDIRE